MNISKFCIRHKVSTILIFVIITIYGMVMYSDLKLTLIPEMSYPGAIVMTVYAGASPEDVEELVTRPIESAAATVTGVDTISSTSSENVSLTVVLFDEDTDTDVASMRLREKFDMLTLPDDCDEPIIQSFNLDDVMPLLSITMTGENLVDVQNLADGTVIPALERIEGVASVSLYGDITQQISVKTDATAMAGYNLTTTGVMQLIAATNSLIPSGEVQNGTNSYSVSVDGKYTSVEDVANTVIPLATGGIIHLSDVATVELDSPEMSSTAKNDGLNCVALTIAKQSGANEVETAEAIKETLEELSLSNPGLQYQIVYDSSDYILSTADYAVRNIIIGVLLAAAVVFLFLRRKGATATIAISMPFCIISVFVIMHLFDITLNMISLGGIAMGVGMIVDNSIVVLENIYRHASEGKSRFDACVDGAKEVSLPIIASTLTTIAVFLPIGLSGGIAGMMFKDFSLTVTFLLLGSLLIAMTLVPLLCYFLLDEEKAQKRQRDAHEKAPPLGGFFVKLRIWYMKVLRIFLRKRLMAMGISIALVAVFVLSCVNTDMILMPDTDQGTVAISATLPVGSDIAEAEAIGDKIVTIAQNTVAETDFVYYMADSTSVSVTLMLVDLSERDRSATEIGNALRLDLADVAGCEISITGGMSTMSTGGDINLVIEGEDYDTLAGIADDLAKEIALVPGAVEVTSSAEAAAPSVKVYVDNDQAAAYGLTAMGIGTIVRGELTGYTATTVTLDGTELEVVVMGNDSVAESIDAMKSMSIPTAYGTYIPLSAVAEVAVELSPVSISRSNQVRQVTITGSVDGISAADMTTEIHAILADYNMPDGYSADTDGSYESIMESFGDLLLALIVAIGLIYFVLASQFESFLMPLIVMMILPLAFAGGLFGLPITGQDLSMVALVGIIMLAGVVVNASIILVDYIKVRRMMGESKEDAILLACPLRIRPIMMTTTTTVLAMVPMALGMGDGAELMQPMSIVMISGMIIATITTLFFTPVYYSVLDSIGEKIGGRVFRKK